MYPIKLQTAERNVNIVRFNYDGDLLFSGSAEKQSGINVFQPYTGQLLGTYQTRTAVKSLDIDLDSKYVVCASFDGTLQLFQVSTGKSLKWAHYPLCKGYHLEFDISSKKLMVVYEISLSTRIRIIDFQSFVDAKANIEQQNLINNSDVKQISNFPIHYGEIYPGMRCQSERALWFVDNQSIFTGTKKGQIIHFTEKGEQINKAIIHKDSQISSIAFSNNYAILATAAKDGCKIIDPITLQILRFFKQQCPMNTVSISPLFASTVNPKYHVIMAGGIKAIQAAQSKLSGFEVHLCNIMDGNQIGKLSTHFSPVNSVQFFKDGRGYVTVGDDGYVVIIRFDQSYFDNVKYQ